MTSQYVANNIIPTYICGRKTAELPLDIFLTVYKKFLAHALAEEQNTKESPCAAAQGPYVPEDQQPQLSLQPQLLLPQLQPQLLLQQQLFPLLQQQLPQLLPQQQLLPPLQQQQLLPLLPQLQLPQPQNRMIRMMIQ